MYIQPFIEPDQAMCARLYLHKCLVLPGHSNGVHIKTNEVLVLSFERPYHLIRVKYLNCKIPITRVGTELATLK